MSTPTNTAAWLTAEKAYPLTIGPAAYPTHSAHEIVVQNSAVALCPLDWKLQALAIYPLSYPTILGQDVAGTVVSVGEAVKRFQPGDRVLGESAMFVTKRVANSAFQRYTVLDEKLSAPIPESLPFEQAAVIPLGVSTAACGLFQKSHLGLRHPTLSPEETGQVVLIWGGASSVGCNAIQLARAAGYEVLTTASAKNAAYLKGLGAGVVFDYGSPTVVEDVVAALKDRGALAGVLDCVSVNGAIEACAEILVRSGNEGTIIATCLGAKDPESVPGGGKIQIRRIMGLSLRENEVGKAIYEDFLPEALERAVFRPAPEPWVVGHGLESVQAGLDLVGKGVSCKKVVVTL